MSATTAALDCSGPTLVFFGATMFALGMGFAVWLYEQPSGKRIVGSIVRAWRRGKETRQRNRAIRSAKAYRERQQVGGSW